MTFGPLAPAQRVPLVLAACPDIHDRNLLQYYGQYLCIISVRRSLGIERNSPSSRLIFLAAEGPFLDRVGDRFLF